MPSTSTLWVSPYATGISGRPLWPSDVSGLVLWLPADQIQGIASGASLSAWTDSSGSASHATQGSAVSQPVYVLNVQNNLSAVSFGKATSQLLTSATSLSDTHSIALALSPSTTALGEPFGSSTTTGASASTGLRMIASSSYVLASASSLTDGTVTAGKWATLIGFSSGSTSTLAVSGTTYSGSIGTQVGASSTLAVVGAGLPSARTFSGYIGEVAVWNRNLFEIERSSVESYLRTKWGI